MPSTRQPAMTPASRRTRALIVDAAITSLAERPSATLAEIAAAADVSRSTLHRHFTDRRDLLAAVDSECRSRFGRAEHAARLGEGDALDALDRLAQEYLGMGEVLGLVFADNAVVDPDQWDDAGRGYERQDAAEGDVPEGDDAGLTDLIVEGQRAGALDRELSPEWMELTLWTTLLAAWQTLQGGASRRDVAFQLSRTIRKAFGPA